MFGRVVSICEMKYMYGGEGQNGTTVSDEKFVMAALIVHVICYLTELSMKLTGKG